MDEIFDAKVREALEYGTDSIVNQKQDVWRNISARTIKMSKEVKKVNRKKSPIPRILTVGTIAAALLLTFSLGTEPGKAAIDKIMELFEPEKNIVQDLEGNKEETHVELEQSKMGYILYVDKDYYDVVKEDEIDRIIAKNQGEGLPNVFMEITQIVDKGPDTVATDIENQLKSKYPIVENRGQVSDPVQGIFIRAASGHEWDDTVILYYLVDNTKGGTFVIQQQYFVEAEEGHGARFYHILKEFQIVDME